jgi:uncharacterized membrane protein
MKRLMIACTLFVGASIAQLLYYYPKLPDIVASHFGTSGRPDSWMDKGPFVGLSVGIVVFISLLFLAFEWLSRLAVSAALRKAAEPDTESSIHRQTQRRSLTNIWSDFNFVFGTATAALTVIAFHLAIRANLAAEPALRHFWLVLLTYLGIVCLISVRSAVRYRRLARDLPSQPELPPGVWFPAKRFGWGWGPPVRWQGWVALAIWFAILAAGIALILTQMEFPKPGLFVLYPFLIVMILAMILLCWAKGEKPRWRWGE